MTMTSLVMRRVSVPLCLALGVGTALPAMAGGLTEPVIEPAPAPVVEPARPDGDWTGFYGGAALSYGDISAGAVDGSGALYGLRAGYDYDFGGWVLGGGLDYDWSDADLDGGVGQLDNVARLRLRAGADLGNVLLYATAGAARAEAEIGGVDLSDDGYFGGVGLDYRISPNWTVGGEILAHRFDDFDDSGVDLDATTIGVTTGFRF